MRFGSDSIILSKLEELVMDKAAAPQRTVIQSDGLEVPSGWWEAQESLSSATDLAILLIDGHQPPELAISNNNSICHAFQTSPTHAHLCDPYCGEAHARAMSAGTTTRYRCHAGLNCFTQPVGLLKGRPLAVIGGRAFLHSADYRALAERVRSGDLSELLSADLFRNVIFAAPQDLDDLATRIAQAAAEVAARPAGESTPTGPPGAAAGVPATPSTTSMAKAGFPPNSSYFPPGTTFKEVCSAAVRSLAEAHRLDSLVLMLRNDEEFITTSSCATGKFVANPPRIAIDTKNNNLLQAVKQGGSVIVPLEGRSTSKRKEVAELFPLIVGEEVKGALIVGDLPLSDATRQALADYCREMALPFEVLRLREELEKRMRAAFHLQAFTDHINAVEPEDAYATILQHSTQLLHAERGSLQMFDESANELAVKAVIGPCTEAAREARTRLGESISGTVLSEGRPLVVRDMVASGRDPAPAERSYKTGSFISYPIMIGGRRVGVLNVTDKAGGGIYDEIDLGLLEMFAPQMALALDRAEWHQKATQFQLLSITDPLTGLLNRRYLEERLAEELERSKRHRFPMSFLMVDIDDFKHYNDRNGHQAGDLALEMTAQCLKSALRSADVASRYGGEEFSILLPQTNLSEAQVISERIRRRVERMQYPHGKNQPLGAVTVSIGISAFGPEHDTPASIIGAADQALYVAKKRGKNRINSFTASNPYSSSNNADREAT